MTRFPGDIQSHGFRMPGSWGFWYRVGGDSEPVAAATPCGYPDFAEKLRCVTTFVGLRMSPPCTKSLTSDMLRLPCFNTRP